MAKSLKSEPDLPRTSASSRVGYHDRDCCSHGDAHDVDDVVEGGDHDDGRGKHEGNEVQGSSTPMSSKTSGAIVMQTPMICPLLRCIYIQYPL